MVLGEMKVKRVHEGGSSWHEPVYDPEWSDLTKLRWLAACVEDDTGVKITVNPGGLYSNGMYVPDVFGISYPNGGMAPFNFDRLWNFLDGVRLGADIMKSMNRRAAESLRAEMGELFDGLSKERN